MPNLSLQFFTFLLRPTAIGPLLSVGRWFNSRPGHFGLSLGKTVYSILPQSTQLENGYPALIR